MALVDIYPEKAQAAKARFHLNADVYDSHEKLFARDDIDLVSICTPPYTHAPLSIACMEHGMDVPKDYVMDDRDTKTGRMDLEKYYKFPKDMPTAFVCNCDLAASYLIRKLENEGYRIPEDVSVVGFDNFLYPGLCDIGITTYEVDISEMARRAIHKIVRKIANENYTAGVFIVDGHVVFKDSVARI